MAAALLVYVTSYMMLSHRGQYVYSQSGKLRFAGTGISMIDIMEWRAAGCWFQAGFINVDGEKSIRGNFLGYFYAPLILLDHKWVHKTKSSMDNPEARQ